MASAVGVVTYGNAVAGAICDCMQFRQRSGLRTGLACDKVLRWFDASGSLTTKIHSWGKDNDSKNWWQSAGV